MGASHRTVRLGRKLARIVIRFKLQTAPAPEHVSAMLNDAADIARAERQEISGHQAREAMTHVEDSPPPVQPRAHNGPDGGVHSRGGAATCRYCDTFHFCRALKLSILLRRFAKLGLTNRPRRLTLGMSAATAGFEIIFVEGAIIATVISASWGRAITAFMRA
jgi:hypothetical protein